MVPCLAGNHFLLSKQGSDPGTMKKQIDILNLVNH